MQVQWDNGHYSGEVCCLHTLSVCYIVLVMKEILCLYASSALTLLVGRQEEHPVCKN